MSAVSVCRCGRPVPAEVLERAVAAARSAFCSACRAEITDKEAAGRLARIAGGTDAADDRIQRAFEAFDSAHPDVFELFKRFSNELLRAGRERYGAKSIMERIRWELATSSSPESDGFKINNNFTSRYARKLIEEDPAFKEFFETRCLGANRGASLVS